MITRSIILDSFRIVRTNTVLIAKDIPADQYGFRPAEGSMTILEMFRHILRLTEFMTSIALHPEQIKPTPDTREQMFATHTWTDREAITTKDQVVDALVKSFGEIDRRVNDASEAYLNSLFIAPDGIEKVRLWVVQCAKEQEMATRGQLFLVERLLGIVPHTTRRQQEREREALAQTKV